MPGSPQLWKHEAQLDWMANTYGYDYDSMSLAEVVAVAFKHRTEWRETPDYEEVVEQHREEMEELKAERRAARQAEEEELEEAPRKRGRPAKKAAPKKASPKKATGARKAGARKGRATRATRSSDPFA